MFSIHGTGLGGGIVVGRAVVLESQLLDVPHYHVDAVGGDAAPGPDPVVRQAEVARLMRAVDMVRTELSGLADRLTEDMPAEAQALLQVHAMILEDPTLLEGASEAITQHGRNAEWAFAAQAETLAGQFAQFDDPYLRERGRDVTQVADRVLKAKLVILMGP